jgi:anaphase-promoting complex subunit 3
MLVLLGLACRHFFKYELEQAKRAFQLLPEEQFKTSFIYSYLARCEYELGAHKRSQYYFELIRAATPHRIDLLDLYSSVLWHVKDTLTLTTLTNFLVKHFKESHITWTVAGNNQSARGNHKNALKCLSYANDLSPSNPVILTLMGHEYLAVGDLHSADTSFRSAATINVRYHNAWLGLAMCYWARELLEKAEHSFRRVVLIHGSTSIGYLYWGMSLAALKQYDDALDALDRASKLDPTNPTIYLHKAKVFKVLNKHQEALDALLHLLDMAPQDINAYVELGMVYKKLSRNEDATIAFTSALTLCEQSTTTQGVDRDAAFIKSELLSLADKSNEIIHAI